MCLNTTDERLIFELFSVSILDEGEVKALLDRKDAILERIGKSQADILQNWSAEVDKLLRTKSCECLLIRNANDENEIGMNCSEQVCLPIYIVIMMKYSIFCLAFIAQLLLNRIQDFQATWMRNWA